MIENEVKLGAPPGFRLPVLDDVCDGVSALVRPDVVTQAAYFDTTDLRLSRSGASLRYRSDDGWTLKLPGEPSEGDELRRRELLIEGPPGTPPARALDLVRGYTRGAPIGVVSLLRTLRRRVDLFGADGERLGEVDDDEVSVLDGRRVGARFREVEVEVVPGAPEDLQAKVVDALRAAGAGVADPVPKVVRALGPRALADPDIVVSPVSERAPARDAIAAAIAASVHRLIAHDAGVRMGEDSEAVHQARVATRRLRSDLRTFRDYVDPEWSQALRDELKWLGGELGAVRDGDVLLARLESHAARLPDDEHFAVERVIARRAAERDDAHASLLATYRTTRYTDLLERLVEAARAPRCVEEADRPASDVLPGVVRGPWKHLRNAVDGLGDDPPDEALHDVRKRAKRCRYAAEAVAPIVGKRARTFARAVADVQDVLGEHQDAVVARWWLSKVAADVPAREAFAAGMLAGVELEAASASERAFPDAWDDASKKRLRDWM